MRMLIAITVYDVNAARSELAKRTGWHKDYSRQRVLQKRADRRM